MTVLIAMLHLCSVHLERAITLLDHSFAPRVETLILCTGQTTVGSIKDLSLCFYRLCGRLTREFIEQTNAEASAHLRRCVEISRANQALLESLFGTKEGQPGAPGVPAMG